MMKLKIQHDETSIKLLQKRNRCYTGVACH